MSDIPKLVQRCQRGDLGAFAALFDRYQSRIYKLAGTILKDREEAKDAVQDTFLLVFKKIDSFEGKSSFDTWLTAVAVNVCRTQLRRRKVRRALSLESLTPRWLTRIMGQPDTPPVVLARRQRAQSLWEMVDQLDDRLRLPLILRYQHDYSCEEIGEILGLATTTIYGQLSEGRRRLRQMMRRQEATRQDKADDINSIAAEQTGHETC